MKQMTWVIAETVTRYHEVDVDSDEPINIVDIIERLNESLSKYDDGAQAIKEAFLAEQEKYGVLFSVLPENCGKEIERFELVDERE